MSTHLLPHAAGAISPVEVLGPSSMQFAWNALAETPTGRKLIASIEGRAFPDIDQHYRPDMDRTVVVKSLAEHLINSRIQSGDEDWHVPESPSGKRMRATAEKMFVKMSELLRNPGNDIETLAEFQTAIDDVRRVALRDDVRAAVYQELWPSPEPKKSGVTKLARQFLHRLHLS